MSNNSNRKLKAASLKFVKKIIHNLLPTIRLLRALKLSSDEKNSRFMLTTLKDDILFYDFIGCLLHERKSAFQSYPEFKKCQKLMSIDKQISWVNREITIRSVIQDLSTWAYLSHIARELIFQHVVKNRIDTELFDKLYTDFESFSYKNIIPFQVICPLHNFQIEDSTSKKVKLLPGLSIRPITIQERIRLGNKFISDSPNPYDRINYVIEYKYNLRKHLRSGRMEYTNDYPSNINSIFASVVTALRLYHHGNVAIYDRYEKSSLDLPVHALPINLYVIAMEASHGINYVLSREQLKSFVIFWKRIGPLLMNRALDYKIYPNDKYLNIKNAILRFNYGYGRVQGVDAFIDNMIALESVFSTKDDPETIATHRFAKRVALFLKSRSEERKKLYCEMIALYKSRSEIVHGEYTEKIDIVRTRDLLTLSFDKYFSHMNAKRFSHDKLIKSLDQAHFKITRSNCKEKPSKSIISENWNQFALLENLGG